MISLVIDQSQPGVFYLQKMMNFMKPGVFYLQKMMNFMKPGVLHLQKMMNFIKMRTFYKKLPLFIKKTQFCILIKNLNLRLSFYKKQTEKVVNSLPLVLSCIVYAAQVQVQVSGPSLHLSQPMASDAFPDEKGEEIIHKVNRCLARYSPRATTTNRPTTGH